MADYSLYHFEEFNEQVYAGQRAENLQDIFTFDFSGRNSIELFSEIVPKKKSLFKIPYSCFKILDEFRFTSQDIKYFTSLLYFLRPYAVDIRTTNGAYLQTQADHRFLTYASSCMQAIYNFWDRIGDLLHLYFKTDLPERNVYLGTVLNNFPLAYKQEPEYVELLAIYNDHIKPFIDERNQVVHYYQLETVYYWSAIEHRNNPCQALQHNAEKLALPDRCKQLLSLCIRGFELALKLIDKLPNGVFVSLSRQPSDGAEPFKVLFAEVILGEELTKLFNPSQTYTALQAERLIAQELGVDVSLIALYDRQQVP